MFRKVTSLILVFCFLFTQIGFTQAAAVELNLSGYFSRMANNLAMDKFRPLHLRYLSYDALSNNFDLLLDKGDFLKGLSPREATTKEDKGTVPEEILQQETKTLLNYFFIGLSLPNESFWVNLRPDSPDSIIDPELSKTDIGRIFLEADLQLKKDTALFTSPQTPEGREYWDKLYKKAEELYGNENITIPTLTRPWIVPGEIIIRESKDNAYIYKATLKVMLEQDYLKDSAAYSFKDQRSQALNEYSSQLIRELIIPKITKEVNSSKRYAPFRQVYYSLILAQWFKQYKKGTLSENTLTNNLTGKCPLDLIDSRSLTDLTSKEAWDKTTYFNAYKKSFVEGEYNIKEPVYTPTGQVIRSYFSGGIKIDNMPRTTFNIAGSPVGNKPYLVPMRVDKNGIVTQPLAGSPVLSGQKIQDLEKELAFYIMVNHDLGNFSQGFISIMERNMLKKEISENSVDLEKLRGLIHKSLELTTDGEEVRENPEELSDALKDLRAVNRQLEIELTALQPLLTGDLAERSDLLMAIVNPNLPYSVVDLREALEWVFGWYKHAYGFKINFLNELKTNNNPFLGNKYQLKRIIGNLLSNSEAAFINNHVDRNKRLVETSLALKENEYIITYKDNAGGIPAELLGKIFEPRFTTKNSEDNPFSGFGMVITKEFIEKMGGTITVESELGKGTTFTITLPAATSSPAAADSDTAASPIGVKGMQTAVKSFFQSAAIPQDEAEYIFLKEREIESYGYKLIGGAGFFNRAIYKSLKGLIGTGVIGRKRTVYSPAWDGRLSFEFAEQAKIDTQMIAQRLLKQGKDRMRILVIGSGTGLDAMTAVYQAKGQGLYVDLDAIDIQEEAVENSRLNFELLLKSKLTQLDRINIKLVTEGKEFVNLAQNYDLILFNAPDAINANQIIESTHKSIKMDSEVFKNILLAIRDSLSDSGVALVSNVIWSTQYVPEGLEIIALMGAQEARKTFRLVKKDVYFESIRAYVLANNAAGSNTAVSSPAAADPAKPGSSPLGQGSSSVNVHDIRIQRVKSFFDNFTDIEKNYFIEFNTTGDIDDAIAKFKARFKDNVRLEFLEDLKPLLSNPNIVIYSTLCDLVFNSFDAIISFYDKQLPAYNDRPPQYKGKIDISIKKITDAAGKRKLEVYISDNGAGEKAADNAHKRRYRSQKKDNSPYIGWVGLGWKQSIGDASARGFGLHLDPSNCRLVISEDSLINNLRKARSDYGMQGNDGSSSSSLAELKPDQSRLIDNRMMDTLLARRPRVKERDRKILGQFLAMDHPEVKKILAKIDRLSDKEKLDRADTLLRGDILARSYKDHKKASGLNRHLTLRELFLRPTAGGADFSQLFLTAFPFPKDIISFFEDDENVQDFMRKIIEEKYLLMKALEVLSRESDLVLINKSDIDELYAYLLEEFPCPETALRLLSLADIVWPYDTPQANESLGNLLSLIGKLQVANQEWFNQFSSEELETKINMIRARVLLEENEGLNNILRGELFKNMSEGIEPYKEMIRNFLQIPFDQKDEMLARIDAESEIEKIEKARLMWGNNKWGPSSDWRLSLEQGVFLQKLPSLAKGQAYDFAPHILSSYIHAFAGSKEDVNGLLDTLGTDEKIVDGWLKTWEMTYRYLWAAKILHENKAAAASSTVSAGSAKSSASPLTSTLDGRESFVLANLIEEGVIDRNIYKEGSLEYEGLVQIIRSIKKIWYGSGEIGILRQWYKHKYLSPEGDFLKDACRLLGWVKQTLSEDAVTILFSNLILNKELLSYPHVIMASLLDYRWDKKSMVYFISLIGKNKENGEEVWLHLLGRLEDDDYCRDQGIEIDELNRKIIFFETLQELSSQNKDLSVEDVEKITWDKMRKQGASPLVLKGIPASSAIQAKKLLTLVTRVEPVMKEGWPEPVSGTQIKRVYRAFDKDGNKLPFVIKVPQKGMISIFPRNILPFAKDYMGGILAPFTVVEGKDAVLLGEEYPFLILQRELVAFPRGAELSGRYILPNGIEVNPQEKKKKLLLEIVKRGIFYEDIAGGYEEYGLDLQNGELYLFDFSFPKFEEIDNLFHGYLNTIRYELGWSYKEDEYLQSLWATEREKCYPVPDVKYEKVTAATSSPAAADPAKPSASPLAESRLKKSGKQLDVYDGKEDFDNTLRFLKQIGVREGSNIVNVGTLNDVVIALAAARIGAHYRGFDLDKNISQYVQINLGLHNLVKFGGSAEQVLGEFSSGVGSESADIKDHSQDFVLILTGALSDPVPLSDAKEVFREALRVIKPGGKIIVGSFIRVWEGGEERDAEEIMKSVLDESRWKGIVDTIKLIDEGVVTYRLSIGRIYRIEFVSASGFRSPSPISEINSSPLQKNQDDLGGVDMRYLGKNTIVEDRDSPLRGQSLSSESPTGTDPNELQEIQRLIQAGIIPSIKRLEECRGSCTTEALLSCIADILRIEEERVTQTEAGLKNLLASL